MKDMLLNNQIILIGELGELTLDHEVYDESFYTGTLRVKRLSNTYDEISITVSDKIWNIEEHKVGDRVKIKGQIRTFNRYEDGKSKLIISVHAREISTTELPDENSLYLEGFICKNPISRVTPLGKEIADLLVAVNRPFGKSDYIPCICWGKDAKFAGAIDIGSKVILEGRMQSRIYKKKTDEGGYVEKTAYEVSAHKMMLGA